MGLDSIKRPTPCHEANRELGEIAAIEDAGMLDIGMCSRDRARPRK
jgi:hypothetical protein